jgi:hypothetical protein
LVASGALCTTAATNQRVIASHGPVSSGASLHPGRPPPSRVRPARVAAATEFSDLWRDWDAVGIVDDRRQGRPSWAVDSGSMNHDENDSFTSDSFLRQLAHFVYSRFGACRTTRRAHGTWAEEATEARSMGLPSPPLHSPRPSIPEGGVAPILSQRFVYRSLV